LINRTALAFNASSIFFGMVLILLDSNRSGIKPGALHLDRDRPTAQHLHRQRPTQLPPTTMTLDGDHPHNADERTKAEGVLACHAV
jgi:hypothetical protein